MKHNRAMYRRAVLSAACFVLAALSFGAQSPRQFRDVPSNHWAAKAVEELRSLGLLTGYPDGRFRG